MEWKNETPRYLKGGDLAVAPPNIVVRAMWRMRRFWTGSGEPLNKKEFALFLYGITLGTLYGFAIGVWMLLG